MSATRHQDGATEIAGPENDTPMGRLVIWVILSCLAILPLSGAFLEPSETSLAVTLIGAVSALTVIGILCLSRAWSDPRCWMAVCGFVLVAAGSGVGRPGEDQFGAFDGMRSWWHLVIGGFTILGTMLLGSFVAEARGARVFDGTRAIMSLLLMGVGYVLVVLLVNDLGIEPHRWKEGRPLRGRGQAVPRSRPARVAAEPCDLWLDAASDEAASVTAFHELGARLEALHAPSSLRRRCATAARQEARHARACTHLAHDLGAVGATPEFTSSAPSSPAVLPVRRPRCRRLALVRLAVESFLDGVVGEGFAARRLKRGSESLGEPHRQTVASIARDEAGHARLSADIVAWALEECPTLVGAALRAAAARTPCRTSLPPAYRAVAESDLLRNGLVDQATANDLWSAHRVASMLWLDELLRSSGSTGTRRRARDPVSPAWSRRP